MEKPKIVTFKFPNALDEMPLGPSAEAGILTEANAGWRVLKPILDHEKCIHCLRCWLLCPEGVIDRTGDGLQIDYNYCKGCGICAHECPKDAIEMLKEGE